MRIFDGLFRFLNALVSRLAGAMAIPVAAFGLGVLSAEPGAFAAAFGSDLWAAIGLSALLSIGGVLLLPSLTRRFFHGPREGRVLRGLLHLAAVGAILVLAGQIVRTAVPPGDYAALTPLAIQGAAAVLGLLALTWLAPGTGLDDRARHAPHRGDTSRRQAALRNLRHRRTPPQLWT